jgi:hypothetical protein
VFSTVSDFKGPDMVEFGGTMALHDTQDHASQVESNEHQCK